MARTCPNCDAETLPDAVHCHHCGVKLDASDPAANDDPSSATGGSATGDWRTAAEEAGVGPVGIPTPRDPHGPHADGAPLGKDSTNWAMGAHLSAFVGAWVTLAFVGPLVVWLVKRHEDPFVERHAREALNFNLLMFGLFVLAVVGTIATLGLGAIIIWPVAGIVLLVWVVVTIVAAVKAANGEEYSYPFNIPLVK